MPTGAIITGDGAASEPALYGLFSSAATVVTDNSAAWQRGFEYETLECSAETKLYSICVTSAAVSGTESAGSDRFKKYYPFSVQTEFQCSTLSYRPSEIAAIARDYIEACSQKSAELEFWTGKLAKAAVASLGGDEDKYPNVYLASPDSIDVTPTPGTGVKTKYGLALLERALADAGCGTRGTIHVTRDVASALGLKDKNGYLQTNLGTAVIAGSGYDGSGPNGTVPSGGQVWMYATGPVTVRLSPPVITPDESDASQAVNIQNNTIQYFSDRVVAVTTSSCAVFAVLVDLDLDYS